MGQPKLAGLPSTPAQLRLSFSLHFLYGTGLRLSELVAARLEDLELIDVCGNQVSDCNERAWFLYVNGKGGHRREVPVPSGLMTELKQYLGMRGLDEDPCSSTNRGVPLIGHLSPHGDHLGTSSDVVGIPPPLVCLSPSAIYKTLKRFFGSVAVELRFKGDDAGAIRLDQSSTHWLRHTHASHAISRGVPLEIAQQNLGHKSLSTLTAYVRTETNRRALAMEAFWASASSASAARVKPID